MGVARTVRILGGSLLLLLLAWPQLAPCEPRDPASRRIAVVVGERSDIEALSLDQVRRIFLLETTRWRSGRAIKLIDRPSASPLRSEFSAQILERSADEVAHDWIEAQLTSGASKPTICASTALLQHYLKRLRDAVGYVWEDEVRDGMRVVAVLGEP